MYRKKQYRKSNDENVVIRRNGQKLLEFKMKTTNEVGQCYDAKKKQKNYCIKK